MPTVTKGRGRPAADPNQGTMLAADGQLPPPARDLASLLDEWREKAAQVDVPAAVLWEWYAVQCATLWERAVKLWGAVTRNLDRLEGLDDPNWARWWPMEERLAAMTDALEHLRAKGHAVVCPSHGIEGVDPSALLAFGWPADRPLADGWEALSHRGAIDGTGSTAWQRYCLDCSRDVLEQVASRKHTAHSQGIDMERLRRSRAAGYGPVAAREPQGRAK